MRKLLCATVVLALTGCANVNGVMTPTWLGAYYDRQDLCQTRNHGGDISRLPSYCGASGNRVNIYNNGNSIIGYTKR